MSAFSSFYCHPERSMPIRKAGRYAVEGPRHPHSHPAALGISTHAVDRLTPEQGEYGRGDRKGRRAGLSFQRGAQASPFALKPSRAQNESAQRSPHVSQRRRDVGHPAFTTSF